MTIPLRHFDLLGHTGFGSGGMGGTGAGGGFSNLSALTPRVIAIPAGAGALDFDLRGGDMFVQFLTAAQTVADFDPALAAYYPITNSYGIEKIGIPLGATQVVILGVQTGVRFRRKTTTTPSYGGTKKMFTYGAILTLGGQYANIATPFAADDAENIWLMCRFRKNGIGGVAATIAGLWADQTGASRNPALRISQSATEAIIGVSTNAAGTNVTITGGALPDGEWGTALLSYNFTTNINRLVYWFDSTGLLAGVSGATAAIDTRPLAKLLLGAQATATNNAAGWKGDLDWVMAGGGTGATSIPTDYELAYAASPGAPPPSLCLADPTKVRSLIYIRSGAPTLDWCSNRLLVNGTGFNNGVVVADSTAIVQRPVNAWQPQVAANVEQIVYTDAEFTDNNCSTTALGMRAQAHHALDADVGAAPDPDTAGFSSIPAGVSLVGIGPAELISAENTSGVSTDTGTLNLTGLTHVQQEGEMEWFLLTARNSADTAAQIRIDFEFLKYGDVSLAAGHRDPFHTARLRMCALSATPDGTNTVFITNLDPVTGQLLDPSTHGQDYDASITTWATIGVAVKAPHFCSWNNDWFIGGVNSTSDPTYITITRDVNGDPLSHVATVVATGTILNPLFIQSLRPSTTAAPMA